MQHDSDLLFRIALTLVPNVGAVHARTLIEEYGNAGSVFKAKRTALEKIEGIGTIRANNLKAFHDFARAEEEMKFIEKYRIQPLFITDENYPKRFLHCYDPPTLLYYRGAISLNHTKTVSIVGTRTNTPYGRQQTERLIEELASHDVVIISGLAFGIDAIAHKTALKHHLPTIGVVGHGLDTIYPAQHKALAKEMIAEGGILTEFMSRTKPDKHNFPIRNRVVAGISDITIVVETSVKGGSMITAEMANSYNRDVFAFPGRTTDTKSSGCNYLIKTNKAILLTDAQQLVEAMGWEDKKKGSPKLQRELFTDFTDDEKIIIDLLKEKEFLTIDELNIVTALSSSAIAAAVLNLELEGVITALPGKRYTKM
ncbi:MAG: DNA-processing protein DprA [Chitinophagaceae bacterium]